MNRSALDRCQYQRNHCCLLILTDHTADSIHPTTRNPPSSLRRRKEKKKGEKRELQRTEDPSLSNIEIEDFSLELSHGRTKSLRIIKATVVLCWDWAMAAESSKEELVRLIKKFGAYLTVKMSNLFSISLRNLVFLSPFSLFFLDLGLFDGWETEMKLELSGFCYLEWRSVSLILGFCAIIWLSWGGFFVFLGTQQWNFVLFCLFFSGTKQEVNFYFYF